MDWTVPFVNYPKQFRAMEPEIMGTVREVLSRGDLMLRGQLRDFETHFAAFVGTRFAVGVGNCTDGLQLALHAAGIGAGDEVITVSHTFVATGAVPVLVDIGDDHNMNLDGLEAAFTPRTRAIIPVHLNGRLCDMGRLMTIARRRGVLVIEDSAQALGGAYDGQRGGSFGLAGCFSFYPAKLLGAYGDGGAVTTNDEELAGKIRSLRDHGRLPGGEISGWSFNSRLDNLQAALLDLKLSRLPEWIARRRSLATLYHEWLAGVPQLRLPPPPAPGPYFDIFQNYEVEAEDRDHLVERLRARGVEILIPWGGRGVHQFKSLGLTHHHLPRTDELFRGVLMLPLHVELEDKDVAYTADVIREFYG
jgi:dTDP-3-amino-2,3,6-trideoxy-4-keto-D-glucose/dTDP-3-amino-3,4,6-trideoxy-alpha-D-glucose/dTDP-2,6-dideoxy-D-kanosamine transaminase